MSSPVTCHLFTPSLNFGVAGPVTAGAFADQIGTIRDGDTNGVFYPVAGGV